ncbi:MAG: hypothetical protein GY765_32700 [bacterium]|nr:hypothetical protein [bacterium]
MSSRYTGFSIFFWIAIVVFIFLLMGEKTSAGGIGKYGAAIRYILLVAVVFHIVLVTIKSTALAIEHRDFLREVKAELLRDTESRAGEQLLKRLYPPGPRGVTDRLPALKRMKVSLFNEKKREKEEKRIEP